MTIRVSGLRTALEVLASELGPAEEANALWAAASTLNELVAQGELYESDAVVELV